MKKEILKQANILQTNLDILTDILTRLETGTLSLSILRPGFNTGVATHSLEDVLKEDYKTLRGVSSMLLKQFLQTRIEETQAALDNL